MQPSQSPFPCHWWGTSLENAGLGDVRPDVGTYGRYKFDQLPPLPFPMRGDFAWLATAPAYDYSIGNKYAGELPRVLAFLQQSTAGLGLQLPASFVKFMNNPALHRRIRSNTDCYLDLSSDLFPSPKGDGYLVLFLADSQGCIFWYLYLTADGSDHAVVSSPDFYEVGAEGWPEEPPDPSAIVFCAESFEAFMCRFWLENEIWFADGQKSPMPAVAREYIERYRRKT
jgi:hypothetical protein